MTNPSAPTPLNPTRLTSKQCKELRALAHHLNPVVQIGQHGWSDGVKQELTRALEAHELIKVKLGRECPEAPAELSPRFTQELGAHPVQTIGRVMVVYRRHPKEPKIKLPAAETDAPAAKKSKSRQNAD